jgi:X-X-X-Leu-X-X-Gly heptad repeat protein
MSAASPHSTTLAKSIVYDPETGDHAMYLDGELIGFARTHQEVQTTLDKLVHELLRYTSNGTTVPTTTLPLPPADTIAEALGVLAAHDDDPTIYAAASQQLAAGVTIAADGADRLIDGVRVRWAPLGERWPWPWRCACGEGRAGTAHSSKL